MCTKIVLSVQSSEWDPMERSMLFCFVFSPFGSVHTLHLWYTFVWLRSMATFVENTHWCSSLWGCGCGMSKYSSDIYTMWTWAVNAGAFWMFQANHTRGQSVVGCKTFSLCNHGNHQIHHPLINWDEADEESCRHSGQHSSQNCILHYKQPFRQLIQLPQRSNFYI